jgi:alpha-tubulin suppressor-like RCC1 family protein
MVLAMTIAVVALSSQAMTACQQAEDTATQHATTTQERTIQGATTVASTQSPGIVTTLRAWGNNYSGQLGDETNGNNRTRPVKVRGLREAKVEEIAAGQGHTLALKEDGTVSAWGDNFFGELGDGTNGAKADSPEPVRVKDLEGVRAVEGGGSFSLALKEDGTVWAWGYNQDGELGNGAADKAKETKCENTSEPGDAQVRSSCTNSPTPV